MKTKLMILACVSAGFLLTGCNDGCGCDLPTTGRDWRIEVTIGHIPSNIPEYPIFVDIHVQVWDLENGGVPPDGLMVALSISPGSFTDGQTEIELPLVNGRLSSTLLIDAAGDYELTVSIEGEGRVVHTNFNVGP